MNVRLIALALVLAGCTTVKSPPLPPPVTTRNYDFIMGAGKAGFETVKTDGNTRTAHFEFNDRGRGPKIDSVVVVDARSFPRSLKTTGNDYLKTPVNETLQVSGGRIAWTNDAENDSAPDGPAFFASMYGAPEENGLLARALLSAPDHKVRLLPAGEAWIRKLGELTIAEGTKSQHVTCYEIGGLGFTPYPVWLDDDNELFGSVSSWSSLIREGWSGSAQKLIDAQKNWEEEESRTLAKRLTHEPSGGALVISNARVFDPVTMTLSAPESVVVRGNRIESVGGTTPVGGEIRDAKGRVLLPGLWDMHQHFSASDGLLDIASGITDARDLGNDVDFIVDLKKKFESNELVGPRIVMAALIDGPGPFTGPTKLVVDTEDDVRKVIDRVASLGFEQTKVYSSIRPELVPFIARYSHEHGMRVSGHIPANMRAEEAVRAGYDEIQHVNMLFLNFLPDVKDTRTPARFTAVAERGALLDLNSAEVKNFIALLLEKKTVLDPTVGVFENLFVARKGTLDPSYAMIADRVPPQVRRGFLAGGLPIPEGMDARYRESFAKMLALVKAMRDAGVPIVAGTDALPGFALHRELELYVQAGIPAPEVLRIATLGAATVARRDKQLGTIEPGKLADLVLIDGDPTTNISDIRRVALVVKDGKVFEPREIEKEIGVLPPR